ncbi:hypothetical protein QVD17_07032 [Tagetes erecta]|uniref:Uncharacterized protein n=1 Tax=Tagetes erecta TaxID=13708 RepID=A0AAD8LLT7_TARER|nr:hypothetical protein QVD17_07032 [Tagetes erecta]
METQVQSSLSVYLLVFNDSSFIKLSITLTKKNIFPFDSKPFQNPLRFAYPVHRKPISRHWIRSIETQVQSPFTSKSSPFVEPHITSLIAISIGLWYP